ncbi:hypothetical protein J4I02_08200 [Paenibacillus polymyxa]|nr:hypothetical protein J4I02_08200 [Paenibacillus polymyxa]
MVEGYTGVFTAFSESSFDNYKVIPSITVEDIDNATNKVLSERSKLGAYQNRLEHAINNINNYTDNLTSAESRIRDADMAKQMTQLAKNQIMLQTSQAILTQANMQPESMLHDIPILDTRQYHNGLEKVISSIVLEMFSYMAERECEKINGRQTEGIAAAKDGQFAGDLDVVTYN